MVSNNVQLELLAALREGEPLEPEIRLVGGNIKVICKNRVSPYTPPSHGQQKFLTLTFRAEFGRYRTKTLWRKTIPKICWNLKRIAIRWVCFPELTEAGMLHYHLMIDTNNWLKLAAFRGWWSRLYGNSDCRGITPGHWFRLWIYSRKQSWYMMNRILHQFSYNSVKILSSVSNESTANGIIHRIARIESSRKLKKKQAVEVLADRIGFLECVLKKRVEIV